MRTLGFTSKRTLADCLSIIHLVQFGHPRARLESLFFKYKADHLVRPTSLLAQNAGQQVYITSCRDEEGKLAEDGYASA